MALRRVMQFTDRSSRFYAFGRSGIRRDFGQHKNLIQDAALIQQLQMQMLGNLLRCGFFHVRHASQAGRG